MKRLKKKNGVIMSADPESSFDKSTSIHEETPSKLDIKRNFLNWRRNIHKKPVAKIRLTVEKLCNFPLGSGTRKDVPFHKSYSILYWNAY